MAEPVCLITGVGPGTGTALVERFVERYRVAMLARSADRLAALASRLPGARAYPCDVSDPEGLAAVIAQVRAEMGDPEVVIHNAVGGAFGDFMTVDPDALQRNFAVNVMALMHLGRGLAPAMIEAARGGGRGVILCTGNTSAYRGLANFAGFAPTKAAQRILAESMARHLGPLGVHVAYLAIDAVIDLPWTRKRYPNADDEFFCKPADIAAACWALAHQPRSAWTFEQVIRPFKEKW
jgi:NAD(P)-dependent dehydrogenase (short-subunit alcohol dehydrogenase family)